LISRLLVSSAVLAMLATASAGSGAPRVVTRTALSAAPDSIAQGDSGPINRVAYEISGIDPADPQSTVRCIYPGSLAVRCRYQWDAAASGSADRVRLVVEIPDIDRGNTVVVRIANAQGQINDRVSLINRSRIVHEIESLLLPQGGQTQLDGRGQSVPSTGIGTLRAITQTSASGTSPPACGDVYPRWVGANATDPVFTSEFGALNGSVLIVRPPARAAIRSDNGPEWLVTYPLAASRVQFIAHYEIEYRVRYCPAD
jgi:hypothetical protein